MHATAPHSTTNIRAVAPRSDHGQSEEAVSRVVEQMRRKKRLTVLESQLEPTLHQLDRRGLPTESREPSCENQDKKQGEE